MRMFQSLDSVKRRIVTVVSVTAFSVVLLAAARIVLAFDDNKCSCCDSCKDEPDLLSCKACCDTACNNSSAADKIDCNAMCKKKEV